MTATLELPNEQIQQAALDEYLALFRGCDLTGGYPTVPLAKRIVWLLRPAGVGELRRSVYGDWPTEDIPAAGLEALQLAFTHWRLNGCP